MTRRIRIRSQPTIEPGKNPAKPTPAAPVPLPTVTALLAFTVVLPNVATALTLIDSPALARRLTSATKRISFVSPARSESILKVKTLEPSAYELSALRNVRDSGRATRTVPSVRLVFESLVSERV